MNRTTVRSLATASLALLLTGLVAGCSDDDDADGRSVAAPAAVCDAAVDLGAAVGGMPEDPAELTAFAEETLVPIGDAFTAAFDGDDATAEAATTLSEAFGEIAETGDPSALFESEELTAAQATIGAVVHEDCALEGVDVTAVEYAYEGVPSELSAGRVSFALTNEGVEDHEIVLFRLNDGVDATFDELMEQGEEAMANLTFTGVAFGGPDSTSYTAVDLEPGTYFLVCFIPVGGGEDGPPHFMEGMQQTITVT